MKSIYILFILILISCSESEDNSEQNDFEKDTTEEVNGDVIIDDLNPEVNIPDGWIQVKMNRVTFLLEKIDMNWEGMNYSIDDRECSFEDTAFFDLWPGDWMEHKIIKVKSDDFEITQMFVQEVTAIGVDSERIIEVPFCRLSNWKTSTSNWIEIEPTNHEFRFETFNNFDSEPLNIELNELKMAIRNSCGEEWFEEFKDAESLDEISYSETTVQYNYKIVTRELKSGKTVENIIVFFTPSSC